MGYAWGIQGVSFLTQSIIKKTLSLRFFDLMYFATFSTPDKYFYLYLMTNPQTNICGCYEYSYSQMVRHTGYSKDTIIRLLDRFQNFHKVIQYDEKTKEILFCA